LRREELAVLVDPVLAEEGFELVTCSISRTPRGQAFRFALDREEGVPVEACARISHRISLLLDANPLLRGNYTLEVSSAGMTRPIWKPEHFRRFEGEKVRFDWTPAGGPPKGVQGVLGPMEGESVQVRMGTSEAPWIPLSEISRAQVQLDPWKTRPRKAVAKETESE
jgi:ribosome maturation factor RimP